MAIKGLKIRVMTCFIFCLPSYQVYNRQDTDSKNPTPAWLEIQKQLIVTRADTDNMRHFEFECDGGVSRRFKGATVSGSRVISWQPVRVVEGRIRVRFRRRSLLATAASVLDVVTKVWSRPAQHECPETTRLYVAIQTRLN